MCSIEMQANLSYTSYEDHYQAMLRGFDPNSSTERTFLDYLYTALTNATAFSPTDTLPLTQTAKVLMGIQGTAAIVTVGLVVARAVNILA